MAGSTSEAEVLLILDNLTKFARHHMHPNRHGRLRVLCDTLDSLRDSIKSMKGNLDKLVISGIRQLVQEAKEAIETSLAQELKRKTRNPFSRSIDAIRCREVDQHLDEPLEETRKKLQEIIDNLDRLKRLKFPKKRVQRREDKPLFLGDHNFSGCHDDQVDIVIEHLTSGREDKLEVITITGMVGLGKSTLARRAFDCLTRSNRLTGSHARFPMHAFVSVTREYEITKVFTEILRQIGFHEEILIGEENELRQKTRSELRKGKFLIVLDDVWTTEAWNDIKGAFPHDNDKQSRVLVTTENKKVASDASNNSVENQLDMRLLSLRESQLLLRKEVFGKDYPTGLALEDHESKILGKCDGLPLAIISFARILAKRAKKIDWWKEVAADVNIFKQQPQINTAMRVRFNQLSNHLKLCFLYFGVFIRDSEIHVWILLRLWIAEGLVQKVGEKSEEDVAEEYLNELVERNLVMVAHWRSNGRIRTCRIHGILLDFCKAEAKEENLFQESFSSENHSRLLFPSSVPESHMSVPKANPLLAIVTGPLEQVASILRTYKLLTILDVRSFTLPRLPDELFSLVLLRFLAISVNFAILPKRLSHLSNLQTLIVQTSSESLQIKTHIWKMELLRHLHTDKSTSLQKVNRSDSAPVNKNLKTLSKISPESCTKELCGKTPNLKELCISGKLALSADLFGSLSVLEHLENLKLLNEDVRKYALPGGLNFPTSLTSLTLLKTSLDLSNMHHLGELTTLEILKVKDSEFRGGAWQTKHGGFPRLRVLYIRATNIVRWEALGNHFPALTSLSLHYCKDLEALPDGLVDMPSLKTVDLCCPPDFMVASSARKIQSQKPRFKLSVYDYIVRRGSSAS